MRNNPILRVLDKAFARLETKLVLLLSYTACLVYFSFRNGVWGAIETHVVIVTIIAFFQFGKEFFRVFFFPLYAVIVPIIHITSTRYVDRYKKNVPAEVVIILGHSDWHKFISWIKPNYTTAELKSLAKLLKEKNQDFSFYTHATPEDVEVIMRDPSIKEVYFFGHGDSHVFCLGTNELLYYCEFKGGQFKKEFVHQVHCGTEHGKPLLDYVVPKENRPGCFFFRKEINGAMIMKEFKRRSKELNGKL